MSNDNDKDDTLTAGFNRFGTALAEAGAKFADAFAGIDFGDELEEDDEDDEDAESDESEEHLYRVERAEALMGVCDAIGPCLSLEERGLAQEAIMELLVNDSEATWEQAEDAARHALGAEPREVEEKLVASVTVTLWSRNILPVSYSDCKVETSVIECIRKVVAESVAVANQRLVAAERTPLLPSKPQIEISLFVKEDGLFTAHVRDENRTIFATAAGRVTQRP